MGGIRFASLEKIDEALRESRAGGEREYRPKPPAFRTVYWSFPMPPIGEPCVPQLRGVGDPEVIAVVSRVRPS